MKKFFLFSMIVLAACSCGQSGNKAQEEQIPEKKVTTVATKHCQVPFTQSAQLKGKKDISILPQVNGTLEQVLVSEGDFVKKGQKLFVINSTPYQAAYDNAAAAVEMAKAKVQTQELEVDATRQLYEKGIVSEHQYTVQNNTLMIAKASLAEAQAALKDARNNLNHTVVCSPHDGVIGNIYYRQGSLVNIMMSDPLTIVSDNSTVYAYVSLNSDVYMDLVREAGNREDMISSIPEMELLLGNGTVYEHKGKVETMSGIIDDQTGAISVRVAFPNPDGILAAGGNGTVRLFYDYDGIVIPRSATYEIQDKHFVYKSVKQDDNSFYAVSTPVEVYRLNEDEYIVFKGLTDGDSIVLEGVRKMTDNMKIIPQE
ncbi:MAG: efflux RND transporter periplasmic adaptor subunit [Bacteroidales bacterium]|nr:efflux RND transporter periplasmic adaptor subunit [Bacteroidales bacterium]